MSIPKNKPTVSCLSPDDPKVTATVVKRIQEMSFQELKTRLAYRSEGVIERQFPDPSPTSRQELLNRLNSDE